MPHFNLLSIYLAWRDWLHEFSLSLCSVIALASILTPLLVLHGLHVGVIEHMREDLLRDPTVLVLIPVGGSGAGFEENFIAAISQQPGTRFAIGRTRDVASELQLSGKNNELITVSLEATAPGDPLFSRYTLPTPRSEINKLELVLSSTAAERLSVKSGEQIEANLGRRLSNGRLQSLSLHFIVRAILPPEATVNEMAFVDMPTLLSIQDFRDGYAVKLFDSDGDPYPAQKRHFESFRAYAKSLEDVTVLKQWFQSKNLSVKTRAHDIARIKQINATLGTLVLLIGLTSGAGFMAFMASTTRAAVRRKWKMIGMLRLIGFKRVGLLLYPLAQALFSAFFGCLLAFSLYVLVAMGIDHLFAMQSGGGKICLVSLPGLALCFCLVHTLALLASLYAAFKASKVEPSTVIREC